MGEEEKSKFYLVHMYIWSGAYMYIHRAHGQKISFIIRVDIIYIIKALEILKLQLEYLELKHLVHPARRAPHFNFR